MDINATLLVEMVAFALFVWFTVAVVWPPVVNALEKRRKKIAEGLESATKGETALADAQAKVGEILKDARDKASIILRQAEERADGVIDVARQQAKKEAETIIQEAHAQIENQVRNAQQALHHEIAGLALKLAGQVVRAELSDAKHQDLVATMIKEWR